MKKLTREKVDLLYFLFLLIAVVLSGMGMYFGKILLMLIAVAVLFGDLIFRLICYRRICRCRHCGEYLGTYSGMYCPHCGKAVDG